MNERIKELAIEAGFYANPDVEKFEKFAELIIEQCCDAAWDAAPTDESAEEVTNAIRAALGV